MGRGGEATIRVLGPAGQSPPALRSVADDVGVDGTGPLHRRHVSGGKGMVLGGRITPKGGKKVRGTQFVRPGASDCEAGQATLTPARERDPSRHSKGWPDPRRRAAGGWMGTTES